MVKLRFIDKLILVGTGVGGVVLLAQYVVSHKQSSDGKAVYGCPFCKITHEMTDTEFALHIVAMQKSR